MQVIQTVEPLPVKFAKTVALWALTGRLLTFGILCIALGFALVPTAAFAHGGGTVSPTDVQAYQGLLADETLCGNGGYKLEDTALCTHGADMPPQLEQVQAARALLASASSPAVVCVGDGVSGKRVQVMYVRSANKPDHYADVVAQLRTVTMNVDTIYEASAQETDGHRRIRFVTTADCQLDILAVELPASATNNFAATVAALRTLGYDNPDRKYLLFVDDEIYCGISTIKRDSQPGLANQNDQQVGYARVDRGCWSATTAAHELTHTLGGVQLDAPHSTGGWHCTDEHDIMCYADSVSSPAMTIGCDDIHHEYLLDCNHDDYFSTNPAADNYLATHWNVANSSFLLNLPNGHPATGQISLATPEDVEDITPSTAISVALTDLTAASVTDDYIQAVKFFQNGTLLDVVTSAPYRWTWPGASELGTYVLTVEIDTRDDMHVTTQPLNIIVKPVGAIINTIYLPVVVK